MSCKIIVFSCGVSNIILFICQLLGVWDHPWILCYCIVGWLILILICPPSIILSLFGTQISIGWDFIFNFLECPCRHPWYVAANSIWAVHLCLFQTFFWQYLCTFVTFHVPKLGGQIFVVARILSFVKTNFKYYRDKIFNINMWCPCV